MSNSSTSAQKPSGSVTPLITEEADRQIMRITMLYWVIFFVVFFLVMIIMTAIDIMYANEIRTHHAGYMRFLNLMSALILLLPIFLGTNKVFAARLQFGREFVEAKKWKEAAASLEAFAHFGQRFLDPTGEAHYLLAVALSHLDKQEGAERARSFVLKCRPSSSWAAQIEKGQSSKARLGSAPKKAPASASGQQENQPRSPKGRRRRF